MKPMDLLTANARGLGPFGLVLQTKAYALAQLIGPAAVIEMGLHVFEIPVFGNRRSDKKGAAGQNFIDLGDRQLSEPRQDHNTLDATMRLSISRPRISPP